MNVYLKKYLIISKYWAQHNRDMLKQIEENKDKDVNIIYIDNIKFKKEIIKAFVSYSGFSPIINKVTINNLLEKGFSDGVEEIYNNQVKYLSIPFYYVINAKTGELKYLETNIGDLKSRFDICKRKK